MLDRIAQRRDDAAVGNMNLDPRRRERMEKVRTDFRDFALAGRVAKVMRVPVDALVVERVEKLRLLDAVGQVDAVLEHAMQPCGAGATGSSANNRRQPALDTRAHLMANRWPSCPRRLLQWPRSEEH